MVLCFFFLCKDQDCAFQISEAGGKELQDSFNSLVCILHIDSNGLWRFVNAEFNTKTLQLN